MSFKETTPPAYSNAWREAERPGAGEAPRYSTYEAPGGEPLRFIQDDFDFSGGQSNETSEYPFDGLWSNERLNKKPHKLSINGRLIGKTYIEARERFLNALLVPTDDKRPGYLDLPFWGRFPVVVSEYSVSEKANEKGECVLRLVFVRAGATLESRGVSGKDNVPAVAQSALKTRLAAIDNFVNKMKIDVNLASFFAASGQIKATLLNILGRIQAPQNMISDIANEIYSIGSIAADIVAAPRGMALSLMNSVGTITAGLAEIKNTAASYSSEAEDDTYRQPAHNNEKAVLGDFLIAGDWKIDARPATIAEQEQKKETENLYRVMALSAAAEILLLFDTLTYGEAESYWRLYEKLEENIDKNDPLLYAALADMRVSLSRELSEKELSSEKSRNITQPLPLLTLSRFLGCADDKLRALNQIEDSFLVTGDIRYV